MFKGHELIVIEGGDTLTVPLLETYAKTSL